MRIPIKFHDIEYGDIVELERNGATIGFKMDETTFKRLRIATSEWEPHPDAMPRVFKIGYYELDTGKWFLTDRLRWRHTDEYEGWAA